MLGDQSSLLIQPKRGSAWRAIWHQEIAITEWMDLYMMSGLSCPRRLQVFRSSGGEYTCCIAEQVGLSVRSTRLQRLPEQRVYTGRLHCRDLEF